MAKKEKASKGKAGKMSVSSSKPAKSAVAAKPAAEQKKASGKR